MATKHEKTLFMGEAVRQRLTSSTERGPLAGAHIERKVELVPTPTGTAAQFLIDASDGQTYAVLVGPI